jgi:chloramphenicol-sensitive protein RarD
MIYALLAYLCWGFFPIYWKFLKHVPLVEILSHRVIWAFVFYCVLLAFRHKKLTFYRPENKKSFWILTIASILLMSNWLMYIYAVNSNQIVAGSLGYFINPLFNILLGVVVLKEKLNRDQITAVAFATIGVAIITYDLGQLPWISLYLASTFCIYGYLKKISAATGEESNQFESFLFVPLSLLVLMTPGILNMDFNVDFSHIQNYDIPTWMFFIGSGLVTGLPLIFFAEATKRIPYYLMGFFQFLAPTLQFLTGVFIFGEVLTSLQLIGFSFIWAGMIWLMWKQFLKLRNSTT